MKWTVDSYDHHVARCGHLYVRVEEYEWFIEWFIEPDEEDKSYRRALDTGREKTVAAAKVAAASACERIIAAMQASLQET
jgi:hypothetical protein